MGLHIDTLKDLRNFLKQSKLEVKSIEELLALLARINAGEDPIKAHQRLAWRHIVSVGKTACIVAGICSFYGMVVPSATMQHSGGNPIAITLGILGILWGGALAITVVIARSTLTALKHQPAKPPGGSEAVGGPNSADGPNATAARSNTDITNDRTRVAASRNTP
jgi:hypothetical protein